ncbi:MAG: RND transporter [Ruminococcus sp.]|uniref:efflux RND transporter periplasmic adaptor subunit n=1 Tax=Ruminococcus sp. TaxID=41978 RepID=UPI0025E4C66E|nr:RND transporter [Ruminococcus sp.]MCR5541629.1 RND transporter [Ruminococcus sp.]
MDNSKRLVIIGICAVTALFSGCGKKKKQDEIAVPILETKSVTYKTVNAEIRDISQKYEQPGIYGYPYSKKVRFPVSGQIKSIDVDAPCEVKKGQLLCTLYTDDLEEEIEKEKIKLDQVKSTVDTLYENDADANQITMAQYDVQIEQMRYDRMVASLEDYNVYAPCDGDFSIEQQGWNPYNVNSNVNEGAVFGYATDKNERYLCVEVFDSKLPNVNFGTTVKLEQGTNTSTGTVTDIVFKDSGDYSKYTYVISPDNADELLDFGDINVVFDIYSRLDSVVIPKKAVKELSGRNYVYLLIDGVKVEQDVELGIEDNGDVEVVSGLSGDEQIIVN